MALPISGPFHTIVNTSFLYQYKTWYRQKRPYDQVLNFDYVDCLGQPDPEISYDAISAANAIANIRSDAIWVTLQNKAYSRFRDKLGTRNDDGNNGQAGVLLNVAQLNQNLDMIANRAKQLTRFFNSIRHLDFAQATVWARQAYRPRSLVRGRPGHPIRFEGSGKYAGPKDAAGLWLEWSFGWAPMLNDIKTALDILGSPGPEAKVVGSASEPLNWVHSKVDASIPGYELHQKAVMVGKLRFRTGGLVRVVNPNLYLYNQLGMANPIPAIWDAIPWSFVVDWIGNVSDFLNSGSDLWGLSLDKAFTSQHIEGVSTVTKTYSDTRPTPPLYFNGKASFQCKSVLRSSGLSTPILSIRPVWVTSWKRAANAVSLLTQALPRK